ncbi:MAG TPA: VWA domain-containing protein [Bryobacteraceae bacterium]|jgi:VWFA-related protein|nr:VWA domain-containing protein [Bryobacteraceae bacterium]
MNTARILLPLLAIAPCVAFVQEGDFKISTSVEMVLLDVAVQDARGGYVSNLPKEAFHIDENGVPQTISAFSNADVPVEVGLVMDASGSMRTRRADVNAAGVAFIQKSNPKDQVFVVNFNDTVMEGLPESVPFTDKIDLLRTALSTGVPQGRTVLYDAIAEALRHLETGKRDKKTLVLVTDGGDNRSQIGLNEIMRLIEESHATIYTVGIFDPSDPYNKPGVLRRIAAVSGGESFMPKTSAAVVPICEKIAKDIRNRYTLGYIPNREGTAVRKVKVSASSPDHGKLIVTSRTSYKMPDATAK